QISQKKKKKKCSQINGFIHQGLSRILTTILKKHKTVETRKIMPWSNEEVQTFLSLVADERIQRELDKNEKVYQEVSQLMDTCGFQRSFRQCREKLKKLKSDYRSIKDRNGQDGSNWKTWKWFDQMEAIYKHRPANNGRTGGHDTATDLMESLMEDDSISEESSPSSIIQQQDDAPSRPAAASTPETAPVVASTPLPSSAPQSNYKNLSEESSPSSIIQQQDDTPSRPAAASTPETAPVAASTPLPSSAPQSKYYKNLSEESSPSSIIQQQDNAPSRPAAAPKPETAPVAASTRLPSSAPQIRRKRKRQQEHIAVLRKMQKSDVEQQELNRAQRDRHLQMALEDAARARELEAALRREEAALRREENTSAAAFNEAFLGTLSQLVQAMSRRPDNTQPHLDSPPVKEEDVCETEKDDLGLKMLVKVKEEEDIILKGHEGYFSKKQAFASRKETDTFKDFKEEHYDESVTGQGEVESFRVKEKEMTTFIQEKCVQVKEENCFDKGYGGFTS
ncbi:hypothetical protein UPYG_G00053310, partial [Umbra pygmaea]